MLTATRINAAKPQANAYKLSDALGLYLYVTHAGGKLWRMKYRFAGREKLLSFGAYPEISLVEAREKRDAARKLLAKDIDPGEVKKAEKAAVAQADSLELVAREWHKKFSPGWSPDYAEAIIDRLELNIFPWLGNRPIGGITAPDLLAVLQRIEKRGALETVRRVKTICSQVWRYAIATARAKHDIAADLRGAFAPAQKRHHAAITEPKKVATLLRVIDGYEGSFVVKCGLQLGALLFVRPGELRHGEWPEFDFDARLWTIPGSKMKIGQDHIVPLSKQAVLILKELKLITGGGRYMLPSQRTGQKPISENTLVAALRSLGYSKDQMTAHGFRAMARTILDEVLDFKTEIIEHQLAHTVKDPNGTAYNRTKHLEKRKAMMQTWADYLDGLRVGAKILSFRKRR